MPLHCAASGCCRATWGLNSAGVQRSRQKQSGAAGSKSCEVESSWLSGEKDKRDKGCDGGRWLPRLFQSEGWIAACQLWNAVWAEFLVLKFVFP